MTRKILPLAAGLAALATAPAAHAELAVGLQQTGASLTLFDTGTPSTATTVPVQGLGADSLNAIAFRPANGVLYGTSQMSKLFTIDISKTPAVATQVGSAAFTGGTAGNAGAGFNPMADGLRLVIDGTVQAVNGDPSLRLDPGAGTATKDTDVNVAGTADPRISGVGYSNLFTGATSTTLYGLDNSPGANPRLVASASPNSGTFTVVGDTGQPSAPGQDDVEFSPATNAAFALLGQGAPMIGSIDAATGKVASVSPISSPVLTEIAIVPSGLIGVVPVAAKEADRTVAIGVTRSRGSVGAVTVDFATADGTAKAGSDYVAQKGTLMFAAGETTKIVSVPIPDDGAVEGDEAFSLTLSKATNGAQLDAGSSSATVTIADSGAGQAQPPIQTGPTTPVKAGPAPTIGFGKRTLALADVRRRGAITVTFTCTSFCQATGAMKLGAKTIGAGKRTFLSPTGGTRTIRVKLTKAGLAALGRRKARTVKVSLSVTDTANQITAKSASFRLTVPKKRRRS